MDHLDEGPPRGGLVYPFPEPLPDLGAHSLELRNVEGDAEQLCGVKAALPEAVSEPDSLKSADVFIVFAAFVRAVFDEEPVAGVYLHIPSAFSEEVQYLFRELSAQVFLINGLA
ncbi:hypothetical protein SDC9_132821 [bioreactor metagenome]|uniref:Uncharacterized protein n=1 Tax=bioreactor metagenome TaxID=1076179 RepID=A0A645D890_9ZZZZ